MDHIPKHSLFWVPLADLTCPYPSDIIFLQWSNTLELENTVQLVSKQEVVGHEYYCGMEVGNDFSGI